MEDEKRSVVIKVQGRNAGTIWKERKKHIERRTYKKPWGRQYSSLQSSSEVSLEGGKESRKMGKVRKQEREKE